MEYFKKRKNLDATYLDREPETEKKEVNKRETGKEGIIESRKGKKSKEKRR